MLVGIILKNMISNEFCEQVVDCQLIMTGGGMWIAGLKLSITHLRIVPRVGIPEVSFLMHPDWPGFPSSVCQL